MRPLNPAATAIAESGIRQMMQRAAALPDTIRLDIGDPDAPTPPHIIDAAERAMRAGATRYAPAAGLPALRDQLAHKIERRNGWRPRPDQIVVTQGATQALHTALAVVARPGNEVLLPAPAWPNYRMMASLLGLTPRTYPLHADHRYLPDADEIESLVTPRTCALVVNSPSNPLGTVLNEHQITRIADLAERHNLWIISDECYDELVFHGHAFSPARVAPHRTIAAYSFSKTYAMTGWRVGYAAMPQHVAPVFARCQEAQLASISTPTQHAAIAALTGPQNNVQILRETYRERLAHVTAVARSANLPMAPAQGTFYAWLDITNCGIDDDRFARELLDKHRVSVAPGSAFGAQGGGCIRLAVCCPNNVLTTATAALVAFINELRASADAQLSV